MLWLKWIHVGKGAVKAIKFDITAAYEAVTSRPLHLYMLQRKYATKIHSMA